MPKKAKREDGRYQIVVELGRDKNGKRVRKYFYGSTQKEALQKKAEYLESMQPEVVDCDISVSDWADKWLSTYASGGHSSQENHKAQHQEDQILLRQNEDHGRQAV